MPARLRLLLVPLLLLVTLTVSLGEEKAAREKKAAPSDKLPITQLAPAKPTPDLCVLKYRISTSSPECQAFFDQGLAYYYSYVWMEAARSFETAAKHDPDCPMAWWGLSRALDKWSAPAPRGELTGDKVVTPGQSAKEKQQANQATETLKKAQEKLDKASHRERLLITARLQEKGLTGIAANDRKKSAAQSIDELLALYDDDEEGWFARAQLADGTASVPYYKALLRVNPLHPGGNHELVHFYEGFARPALGWNHAENYMKSSPGIPHAFHMQAHLATRLGRWDKTADRSSRAVELERAYHKHMNVKPSEDHQFGHHLEILTVSLIHDGRFKEAHDIRKEALSHDIKHAHAWFRLHLAEQDWGEAKKTLGQLRRKEKLTGSYLAALLYLRQGKANRALAEIEVLQHAFQEKKTDRKLESRLWETQGLYMCQTGNADAGLKLLAKAADRSKDDYGHHSWGNGAYFMEAWGLAALKAGKTEVAEEAFLEALAHDPGSVRGALGLQVLCERAGRTEDATSYAKLAKKCWNRADSGWLEKELEYIRDGSGVKTTRSEE